MSLTKYYVTTKPQQEMMLGKRKVKDQMLQNIDEQVKESVVEMDQLRSQISYKKWKQDEVNWYLR